MVYEYDCYRCASSLIFLDRSNISYGNAKRDNMSTNILICKTVDM